MLTLTDLQSGRLDNNTHIKIAEQLSHFPRELFNLADHLEVLDLSGNQLTELPDDFDRFQHLRILFLSNNQFEHVPEILAQCPNLSMVGFKSNRIHTVTQLPPKTRWLILTDNVIKQLPEDLGRYTQLQKLMLAGNQLSKLPDSIQDCQRLELIRLSANQFTQFPEVLFKLSNLAWLAFAGNPCCNNQHSEQQALSTIAIQELAIEELLGEGASGHISRALWQQQAVAVKIFKGDVTSDGYPTEEMAAAIAAGQHPNLIKLLAKLDHPTQAGLILELIDPAYRNLAAPPSLASCTRDIYPDEHMFSPQQVSQILIHVAAAAQHLHQRNIMHGDLYAHNLLINQEAHCLLGDFGAATRYDNCPQQPLIEAIEVRAYANLIEELLNRSDNNPALQKLQQQCSAIDLTLRPSFTEIQHYLTQNNI